MNEQLTLKLDEETSGSCTHAARLEIHCPSPQHRVPGAFKKHFISHSKAQILNAITVYN
jgi:hypothetical protein